MAAQITEAAQQLQKLILSLDCFQTDVYFYVSGRYAPQPLELDTKKDQAYIHVYLRKDPISYEGQHHQIPSLIEAFKKIAELTLNHEVLWDTLSVSANYKIISNTDPLFAATKSAWLEAIQPRMEPRTVSDPLLVRSEIIDRWKCTLADELLKELRAEEVARWNSSSTWARELVNLKAQDFSGLSLAGVVFDNLDLQRANFAGCNLEASSFHNSTIKNVNFQNTNLSGANLSRSDATNGNFVQSSLRNADLASACLTGAEMAQADLSGAHCRNLDVRGTDLSTLEQPIEGIGLDFLVYDHRTKLPADLCVKKWSTFNWHGPQANPHKEAFRCSIKNVAVADFDDFIEELRENFDTARMNKALKMLQKERFQLYSEVNSDSITGVVKSQTDPDLVYACLLTSEGQFACCTQNLRACGGLKGALCKHLLVLLIGTTKAEEIPLNESVRWILYSLLENAALKKEIMSDIFLKYHGTQTGMVDWRPTETIPEDYYSY